MNIIIYVPFPTNHTRPTLNTFKVKLRPQIHLNPGMSSATEPADSKICCQIQRNICFK